MAGCCPLAKSGTAFSKVPPRSGFCVALRYRVHHFVSTVNCFRLVSRPFCGTPVTRLGGRKAKLAKIDGLRTFRRQVIVEELMMADLVVGIVGDVLRHVAVEHLKCNDVIRSKPGCD